MDRYLLLPILFLLLPPAAPQGRPSYTKDLTTWPNAVSCRNSDPWIAEHHDRIRRMEPPAALPLIPKPMHLERRSGTFRFSVDTRLYTCPEGREAARFLAGEIRRWRHIPLAPEPSKKGSFQEGAIDLELSPSAAPLGPEGYILEVDPGALRIRASHPKGLFYGAVTLLQLLLTSKPASPPSLPCLSITDRPRFRWRGLMLDCSRTFQSPGYIRKTIDRMAFYKMNVLHLHLTDDQGWRLEIKKYPGLTAKGAFFPKKYGEPPSHQGYYTQSQAAELVRYASKRNITIVPEIEMPGHSLAALSSHPELSCTGGPFEIYPFFKGPSITKDIFCAGKEKTFTFLENVLAEVMDLFPGEFIHIGGDEAPKTRWRNCPLCRARMRKLGLKDAEALQGWFTGRIAAFVRGRGRRAIGWDEILQGGLPPGTAVMSWRGTRGGIAAARAGHDVVMCPTGFCYFDYSYKKTPTRKVYSFEPVPPGLTPQQEKRILGLQANFWSHIDREPDRVDRRLFPRLLALAERGWSPKTTRDWKDFQDRLRRHIPLLEARGISVHREREEERKEKARRRSGSPVRSLVPGRKKR